MFVEYIWKRKKGDNRFNECVGDNSSFSGRIISLLWFNMMIDYFCLLVLFQNSDEGRRDLCQSLYFNYQKIENIFVCYLFFLL